MTEGEEIAFITILIVGGIFLVTMPIWIEDVWNWFKHKWREFYYWWSYKHDSMYRTVYGWKKSIHNAMYNDSIDEVTSEPYYKKPVTAVS